MISTLVNAINGDNGGMELNCAIKMCTNSDIYTIKKILNTYAIVVVTE
jgi:hypothetical protein